MLNIMLSIIIFSVTLAVLYILIKQRQLAEQLKTSNARFNKTIVMLKNTLANEIKSNRERWEMKEKNLNPEEVDIDLKKMEDDDLSETSFASEDIPDLEEVEEEIEKSQEIEEEKVGEQAAANLLKEVKENVTANEALEQEAAASDNQYLVQSDNHIQVVEELDDEPTGRVTRRRKRS